jgi:hypothetical protein
MKLLTPISVAAVSVAGILTPLTTPAMAASNAPLVASPSSSNAPAATTPDQTRARFFAATLRGRNEVPVAGGPAVGDPDGRAAGIVRVQGNRVTFSFAWKGVGVPTMGHIHQGHAGVNGADKVPLFMTTMPATVTAAAGVTTIDDAATAAAIRSDPGGFYLNLHTAEFPGGAVRGQLTALRHPADLLGLPKGGPLTAYLSGSQEMPAPHGPAVGDDNGSAVTFIEPRGDKRVDYSFAWAGIGTPTMGHIHDGRVGVSGPTVVPLFTTAMPGTIVAASGSVTDADASVVRRIRNRPSQFYVNLHTAGFPGGAVRGQLFRRR